MSLGSRPVNGTAGRMPPIAILAGGLATRLRPTTLKTPKSMIDVAGKPFIHHQLTMMKRRGISRVVLCVGNLGKQIEAYVGDGSRWGLSVAYSYDGPVLLGTGGALKSALTMLPDVFFVMYGDSYLDTDYTAVLERFVSEGKPALMTVYHNRNMYGKSNILFEDGRIVKYDKVSNDGMEHIDYGLGVVSRGIFDGWPNNRPFDLSDVYAKLVREGDMAAFEVDTRFYEIGSVDGIKETDSYLSGGRER